MKIIPILILSGIAFTTGSFAEYASPHAEHQKYYRGAAVKKKEVIIKAPVYNSRKIIITHAAGLPPEPGKKGKDTLMGIDSDEDGVRDDIQIFIGDKYPNDKTTRDALTQFSLAFTDFFEAVSSRNTVKMSASVDAIAEATLCVQNTSPNFRTDMIVLESMLGNTSERREAFMPLVSFGVTTFEGRDTNSSFCK